MGLHYPLVDVADLVAPDNGPDLRAAISGSEGSSTTAFFLTLDSNAQPVTHRHNRCDEITVCLEGAGQTTIGEVKDPSVRDIACVCRLVYPIVSKTPGPRR